MGEPKPLKETTSVSHKEADSTKECVLLRRGVGSDFAPDAHQRHHEFFAIRS